MVFFIIHKHFPRPRSPARPESYQNWSFRCISPLSLTQATFLEENGIDGEWAMFKGEFMPSGDNGTGMAWGGLTSYIEGTSLTLS